eukprot:6569761-Karenia_brevis.AAC.1
MKTIAPDQWHPRHFSMLSEEALESLAAILNLCEDLGRMPGDQESLVIGLIDKPTGGTRPI